MLKLTPLEAYDFVTMAFRIKKVPYISGTAGIGKSDLMSQVAEDNNLLLIDVRLSQKLPEDIVGFPNREAGESKATYVPFDTFPIKGDKLPVRDDGTPYDGWLVFLDELSSASEDILAASYSIIRDRLVGGHRLHDNVFMAAAGNRSTDSAIAQPLPDTIISRMICATMVVDAPSWTQWVRNRAPKVHNFVADFIDKYPDMLMSEDRENRAENEPYANPRTWAVAGEVITMFNKDATKRAANGIRQDAAGMPISSNTVSEPLAGMYQKLIYGAIGNIYGKSVVEEFNQSMELPFAWSVAQAPTTTPVPTSTIGQQQMAHNLAEYYKNIDASARESLAVYLNRMTRECRQLFFSLVEGYTPNTTQNNARLKALESRLDILSILPE